MTLKKYSNVILYFIILLNLVVVNEVIAQTNTLLPTGSSTTGSAAVSSSTIGSAVTSSTSPSSTTSGATPSSTLTPPLSKEDCDDQCKKTNNALGVCGGTLKTPSSYIKDNVRNGTYKPESYALSKCMCNQRYYDMLSKCIECSGNMTNSNFRVLPIQQYTDECKKIGTPFTQEPRAPSKALSYKLKIMIVLIVVLLGLLAIAILQCFRTQRRKKKQAAFAQKFASGNESYAPHYPPPPPTSTSQYIPPTDYPPPSQPAPYYPPPGSEYPPPQSHPPQGGQADSYYNEKY